MTISILLPVFNTAAYLPACLDSILAQTDPDFEILAVDDFSTDDSLAILHRYARQEARLRVFSNLEKGVAPALQLAFHHSTGPLVSRMDSDDLMPPQKLERLRQKLLSAGPGHVAVGLVSYFSDHGVGEGYRRYADWLNDLTRRGENYQEIYKECVIPSPGWLAWRTELERCGAFTTFDYPEDYDLCFRLRQTGAQVAPVPQVVHHWRDRPDRASRTDPNYRDNTFLTLKTRWFLQTDRQPQRPLVLWGAGKKGKRLARLLNEAGVSFGWVTNNGDKIGHEIRGVELRPVSVLGQLKDPQIIVAVAGPQDQADIRATLHGLGFAPLRHYFFFC